MLCPKIRVRYSRRLRREEIEFVVSDPDGVCTVGERLRYQPNFRYQECRTRFRAAEKPGIITVDELSRGSLSGTRRARVLD